MNDFQPSGPARGDFLQSRQGALVALDGNDLLRPFQKQGARQPARAGADLDDHVPFQRCGGARDAAGEVEIQQEVLPQRLLRAQT